MTTPTAGSPTVLATAHGAAAVAAADRLAKSGLRLATHVRACHVGEDVLLMDLKRDRYRSVSAAASAGMHRVVHDWPAGPDNDRAKDSGEPPHALAERLRAQGLLTESPQSRQPDPPLLAAARSLDVQDMIPATAVAAGDLAALALAASNAALWLRFKSTEAHALETARSRRGSVRQGMETDTPRLHEAVAVYEKLRPLFFTAKDKCLLDSFALLHFLARRGLHPHLVVGVRPRPFRAHAWVQCADLVLNDRHERVARFTPILIV
jgi:hypothetical protein